MIKNTLSLLLFLISMVSFAQNLTDGKGLKQGKWSKKHSNGELRYEGEFKDDKEVGTFKFYDKKGRLISIRSYQVPGETAQCEMYNFYGDLHAKGTLKNRKKEGEWIFYSNRGQDTVSVENYNNGVLHGVKTTYFSNGQLASKIEYNQGKKTGEYVEYYRNGQVEQSGKYVDGELDGEVKFWHSTGVLKRQGSYKMGDKIGKWISYDINGRATKVIDYSKKQ